MSGATAIYEAAADQLAELGYVSEAIEMLGTGYSGPSVEIEAPRRVIERRNGRMVEGERPAFVKIYTNFKEEMKDIDEVALKVWLYIALSVNRKTGTANPGYRKIAKDCGLDKDTVARAVIRLEALGLMDVEREDHKSNIYEPSEYVSASQTVPMKGTEAKTVPIASQTVPIGREKFTQPESTINIYTNVIVQKVKSFGWELNTAFFELLATWREIHSEEKILLALDKSYGKNVQYANAILRGWERDGYPQTRGERVKSARKPKEPAAPQEITYTLDGIPETF